jgi:AhpD family alkylhydroperoxidase
VPIFEPVQECAADDQVEEAYGRVKANYGGVLPELYKHLANHPTYLASLTEHMGQVMGPGKLDATTKEIIAFVVSTINGCDYCIHAHKFGLAQQGLDDEAIAEALAVTALWEEVNRFAIVSRLQWKS